MGSSFCSFLQNLEKTYLKAFRWFESKTVFLRIINRKSPIPFEGTGLIVSSKKLTVSYPSPS